MQLMGKQQETAQKGELDAQKMYLDASMEQQKMASEIETKQKLADIEITKKLAELDVEKQKSQMDMQKKVMEIATRQEKPTQGV